MVFGYVLLTNLPAWREIIINPCTQIAWCTVSMAHTNDFNAYLKRNRVTIVITRNTIEIDIPMYEMKVSGISTSEGVQSSCLRQISYVQIITIFLLRSDA